jgi:hypothetical protein
MLFLATHLGILLLTLFFIAVGSPFVACLPRRLQPAARAYLTPALGLSVSILPVTFLGWFGDGFRSPVVHLVVIGIFAIALFRLSRRGPRAWRPLPRQLILITICALPFTLCLLVAGCFDPFNDAWTYLVQSQWLQHHNLRDSVPTESVFPAYSQIQLTQGSGTRAGAQFLLAWVQGMFGLSWAHEAYPILIGAALGVGSLTVAFAASLCRGHARALPILGAIFASAGLNGFSYGALFGFLPQTVGLACASMTLWLTGATLASLSRDRRSSEIARASIPTALGLAATLYAYGECVPLLVCAMGVGVVTAAVAGDRDTRTRTLWWAAGVGLLSLVLVAPELPRFVRAIVRQSTAVVGNAVDWPTREFLLHALGLRSGNWDTFATWLIDSHFTTWVLRFALLLAIALRIAGRGRLALSKIVLLPALGFLAVSALLFFKFRYFTANPFPTGVGQSWSQFKLAGWSTLPALSVLVVLGASDRRGNLLARLGGGLFGVALAICAVTGLIRAKGYAEQRTALVVRELGMPGPPLQELQRFFAEVNQRIGPDEPVRLLLDDPTEKITQLAAYFMMNRPVLAVWASDGPVYSYFSQWPTSAQMNAANWIIARDESPESGATIAGGRFRLHSRSEFWAESVQISGGYLREPMGGDFGYWVEDAIEFRMQTHAAAEPEIRGTVSVSARIQSPLANQRVRATVVDANGQIVAEQILSVGAEPVRQLLANLTPEQLRGTWTLRLRAEIPGQVLGPNDPRHAAFFVRIPRVELARTE